MMVALPELASFIRIVGLVVANTVFTGLTMTKRKKYIMTINFVTLHATLMLKVMARSQHAYTTRFVCPEDTRMCIFHWQKKGGHTCFVL